MQYEVRERIRKLSKELEAISTKIAGLKVDIDFLLDENEAPVNRLESAWDMLDNAHDSIGDAMDELNESRGIRRHA